MNQTPKGWTEIEAGKEQGHTPTPWHCNLGNGSNLTYDGTIWGPNGVCIGDIGDDSHNYTTSTDKANAQFICKAVNCHDELVEACRMMVDAYGACECTEAHKREGVPCPWCNARAVLAKARGEA